MTKQELFIRSNEELLKVIDKISEDNWNLDMPKGSSRKPTKLNQAVRYHTYDDAWVPDVLDGKNKEEVGDKYDYLLNNEEIKQNYKKYNEIANEAVKNFKDLEKITHLSYGDYPAKDYLQHIISFRSFRAYDIAKLIGIELKLPEDYIRALIDEFTPVLDLYRSMGVFPPEVKVPDDASLQTKLFAMIGRQ
jgi:hypothetical protein